MSAYAGLLISLPLILFQIYAFVLPAFSPREKQVALPAMLGVPFLFIGGVVFGYFTVVPRAIEFLQNFNTDAFDVLIQAQPYYKFVLMLLIAMGLLFQIPIGIIAVTRVGIVSTSQLAHNRRYAILVIAVLAMLLPGQDPITMAMMMAPMYVLFEGSILLSWLLDRRAAGAPTPRTRSPPRSQSSSPPIRTSPHHPMLFDLRSGGRRRTVKVVYLGLALLMFVGFVGFGIGSSGLSGGIGDLIGDGSSGGGDNAAVERLSTQVQHRRRPRQGQPERRRGLGRARAGARPPRQRRRQPRLRDRQLHRRGPPPADRRRHRVGQVRRARARRARRAPRPPDGPGLPLAQQPGQGRRRPGGRHPGRPDRADLPNLALLAYQAGQIRKGDLAAAKAVDLAPKDEQKELKDQLEQAKSQAAAPADPADRADAHADRRLAAAAASYPVRPRPCSSTGRAADS